MHPHEKQAPKQVRKTRKEDTLKAKVYVEIELPSLGSNL
jgi:hypothetical protein